MLDAYDLPVKKLVQILYMPIIKIIPCCGGGGGHSAAAGPGNRFLLLCQLTQPLFNQLLLSHGLVEVNSDSYIYITDKNIKENL